MAPCTARSSARAASRSTPGRQPAEELRHPVHAAVDHRRVEMVRAGHDVGDDFGLLRIRHGRLEDADDGGGAIAQRDGLADDRRIAAERGGPEAMGEHRRAVGLRPVVAGVEQPPQHGTEAHHLEVGAADDAGAHRARLAEAEHGELDGGEVAERGERLHARLQVAQLGHREVRVLHADALRALADVDEPVLVAVDERPQQHAADDAEDGGVGADAERQREHDGDGQALGAGERAKRELEVGDQAHGRLDGQF